MNAKTLTFLKNISYTLSSNVVTLIISALVVFILPKLLSIEEYGYWQLFIFYSSYVPFLQFGWSDGVYLRYGGREYKELDKNLFFSQFFMLFLSQIFIAIIIFVSSNLLVHDIDKSFIFFLLAIFLVLVNTRYFFIYLLQATNRFKEYSRIILTDRVLYISLIIAFLFFGARDYKIIIISELIGKLISVLYGIYCCRDILYRSFSAFKFNLGETIKNVSAGFKLTLSNTASMLIIGVNRFGIERFWDVSTFAKVSLTLNISNFMMIFINAVGIILFPILKRTNKKKLPEIYVTMRTFLMVLLLGALIVYYPLNVILSAWLPNYAESLIYMTLVLPICVYEGKMALLINTYLKSLRKENLMLTINSISLVISTFISFLTIVLLGNLDLAIVSIVFSLALRSVIAELLLSRIINISVYKDLILEISMTVIFIFTGWYLVSWLALIIYLIAYGSYLTLKRRDIKDTLFKVRVWMKA